MRGSIARGFGRTFFAVAISFSISSVDRFRASSRLGMAICGAAAREATRAVATGRRSALVETSASASSTRRKSIWSERREKRALAELSARSCQEPRSDAHEAEIEPDDVRHQNFLTPTVVAGTIHPRPREYAFLFSAARYPAAPRVPSSALCPSHDHPR